MPCSFCITEYQEKIDSCKEKIDKAKVETIADDELNALQSKMEEKQAASRRVKISSCFRICILLKIASFKNLMFLCALSYQHSGT